MKKAQLIALIGSASIVIGVAFAVLGQPASSVTAESPVPSVVSESTTLAAPVTTAPSTTSTTAAPARRGVPAQPAAAKPSATVPQGMSATTTPNMPPEPIAQQHNIPGPCSSPDICEFMPTTTIVGEDYDLPSETPAGL